VFFLEDQIYDVVHNPDEMGGSIENAVSILKKDAGYQALFKKSYPDSLNGANLRNALASYIRSLVPEASRIDHYLRADEPKAILTTDEKLGFNVFMGKGKCGTCHYFPIFNGTAPPNYIKTESEIIGTPATAIGKQLSPDLGRAGFTGLPMHQHAFKTPTLRGIGKTAPYMHNGAYQTLEEVVDFYNKGGGKGLGYGPENQTLPFDKLKLSAQEKRALVAFMKAL
jgi:cytochrome c peroxidase